MKIDVLTIFPEMFTAVKSSILGKAEERGILDINLINIRDYTLEYIEAILNKEPLNYI